MTTPINSPEPDAEGAPAEQVADPVRADPADATPAEVVGAGDPAPPDAAAPPGSPPPPGAPGPPWGPPAYPFAPVYRAPRTPWVNPARRAHLTAALIAGALVFGGGGLLVGHALSDDHGDRHMQRHGDSMKGQHGPDQHGPDQHGPGQHGQRFGPGQAPRHPGGPGQLPPNGPGSTSPTR